ncbi:MAG: hypothetical protein QM736_19675 [Vicinamibacterales bacterium]
MSNLPPLDFYARLRWLDGRPLLPIIEPYRRHLFERFNEWDVAAGRCRYNLGLFGRGKKNWKTADAMLNALYALIADSTGGNQVYIVANDEGQAADNLTLLKKLIAANPWLESWVRVKKNVIERCDGRGFIEILPAKDAVGAHGKTYRLLVIDEIHGYRNWDLLEALAPNPTRPDAQIWITSYATLLHKPGVPLYDLQLQAKAGRDPRMLFSWYAADFCTDPSLANRSPEERANPSMASWRNPEYLEQQRRRQPAHKYRRLHLNLPGLPEGSAFQAEPVMDAVARGVRVRLPESGLRYVAFVDMSGGSSDDAVLAVVHLDDAGRVVVDTVEDQGARPPFDPNAAVSKFAATLTRYGVSRVTGDRYAGETFRRQFEALGIGYDIAPKAKSDLYEAFEPLLNSRSVVLLDFTTLEQQMLGLVWRGGRIDHPSGEHDDYANAVCGAAVIAKNSVANDNILQYLRMEYAEARAAKSLRSARGSTDEQESDERARHRVRVEVTRS